MRTIVNISLPQKLSAIVNQTVSSGKYATKSEFFREILRDWIETQTLRELKSSQKQLHQNQGVLLRSLKDLR